MSRKDTLKWIAEQLELNIKLIVAMPDSHMNRIYNAENNVYVNVLLKLLKEERND